VSHRQSPQSSQSIALISLIALIACTCDARPTAYQLLPCYHQTYLAQGILPSDPFQIFDQEGVGKLVEMATTQGKQQNPDIKNGVCGEHGGEAGSVKYFYSLGHDYVSCSPFRVPIARLAAAQAATAEAAP